ncbi:hypothetical protein BDV97DRAFT_405273 [Delphinella strobiligena]|nr:hypothetical protein BDV97DRAFT_405273 [Delphinella strobiligena]
MSAGPARRNRQDLVESLEDMAMSRLHAVESKYVARSQQAHRTIDSRHCQGYGLPHQKDEYQPPSINHVSHYSRSVHLRPRRQLPQGMSIPLREVRKTLFDVGYEASIFTHRMQDPRALEKANDKMKKPTLRKSPRSPLMRSKETGNYECFVDG